jgi:hypothetical protein
MAKQIRPMAIYINSRKVAEVESSTYEHMSNDEAQIGTEGYVGHSDGAEMTRASFTGIIPVAGMEVRVKEIIKNKEYVTMQFLVDGDVESAEGRITGRNYSSDNRSGKLTGVFNFEGGAPTF